MLANSPARAITFRTAPVVIDLLIPATPPCAGVQRGDLSSPSSTSKPRDSNPVGPGTLPGRKVSPIQVNGDQGLGGYSLTGRRSLAGEPDVCEEAVIVPVELVPLFLVLGVDRNIIVAKPEPGILPGLMLNADEDIDDLAFGIT